MDRVSPRPAASADTPPASTPETDGSSSPADLVSRLERQAAELEQARRTCAQLETALESRIIIEQAKGLLAGERGLTMERAFEVLRSHARRNNVQLHAVADAVVRLGLRPDTASHSLPAGRAALAQR